MKDAVQINVTTWPWAWLHSEGLLAAATTNIDAGAPTVTRMQPNNSTPVILLILHSLCVCVCHACVSAHHDAQTRCSPIISLQWYDRRADFSDLHMLYFISCKARNQSENLMSETKVFITVFFCFVASCSTVAHKYQEFLTRTSSCMRYVSLPD